MPHWTFEFSRVRVELFGVPDEKGVSQDRRSRRRDAYDGSMEPSELLAAIGTALGLEHPYEEISGLREEEISVPRGWVPPKERSLHVLGGAEDAHGRVAWIEEVVHGSEEVDQPYMTDDAETGKWVERTYRETWVHSNLVLRAAKAGKELRFAAESRVEVPTYNPYFGCEVGRMLWMGDAVVTLYREKHETIVWVVPLEGEPRLVTVTSSAVVHGTDLYFQGREPGILLGVSLPDLRPLVPIPTVTTVDGASLVLAGDEIVIAREGRHEEKEEGIPVERVRLPERGSVLDPEKARALPARVIEALFGERPPQPTADLLVGAVLTPFYDPRIRIRKTYDEGYEHWFSPHWLPAYWHRFLVLQKPPPWGWSR